MLKSWSVLQFFFCSKSLDMVSLLTTLTGLQPVTSYDYHDANIFRHNTCNKVGMVAVQLERHSAWCGE